MFVDSGNGPGVEDFCEPGGVGPDCPKALTRGAVPQGVLHLTL